MSSLKNSNRRGSKNSWTSLVKLGTRALSFAGLCLLANRSGSGMFTEVQAVNADKVGFQVFEIDSPLKDILWCGQSNDVIFV